MSKAKAQKRFKMFLRTLQFVPKFADISMSLMKFTEKGKHWFGTKSAKPRLNVSRWLLSIWAKLYPNGWWCDEGMTNCQVNRTGNDLDRLHNADTLSRRPYPEDCRHCKIEEKNIDGSVEAIPRCEKRLETSDALKRTMSRHWASSVDQLEAIRIETCLEWYWVWNDYVDILLGIMEFDYLWQ